MPDWRKLDAQPKREGEPVVLALSSSLKLLHDTLKEIIQNTKG